HGLNELGICSATLMPYEGRSDRRRRPSEQALADARQQSQRWRVQWIKRWDLSRGLSDDELLAIKQAIASGHPVACGLRWPKKLEGASLDFIPADAVFDGHSIAFTGYADDESRPGEGVLHFRNSFGGRWGGAGQGSMTYA